MKRHPKNIIVTGTPGAWTNQVSLLLAGQGWLICWPGQDLDIRNGLHYFHSNGQNIEIENIHACLELAERHSRWSRDIPAYFETPFPGPAQFISKFEGEAAVIAATCVAPRLDMWRPAADIVIDIQATKEEDFEGLRVGTDHPFSKGTLEEIRQHQIKKYREHLKLFPKVFTISNAEVKDQRFDILSDFLNSVF